MYKAKIELQGIEETITNPVVLSVMKGVNELIGIVPNVKLFLNEDADVDVDKINNQIKDYSGPRSEYVVVKATEDSSDGTELSMLPAKPDTHPIYYDKEINAKFIPAMHQRTMRLNVRYYNNSKSKITSIINRLKLMTSSDGMYKLHDLEYYYTLPGYILLLLSNIVELKNNNSGVEPIDDLKYIATHFDNRIDWGETHDGREDKSTYVIREAQNEVMGYITTELHNLKPQKDAKNTKHFIELEYELSYSKPIALFLYHPIMIYNQIINKQFRQNFNKEKGFSSRGLRMRSEQGLNDLIHDSIFIPKEGYGYIKYPEIDNITLPKPIPNVVRYLCTMIILQKDKLTELMYLEDIPNIKFKENVIKLFYLEKDYLGKKYKSILYLDLYNYNKKMYKVEIKLKQVTIDGGIKHLLYVDDPLDIKGEYRVMYSVMSDLNFLNNIDSKRLKEHMEQVNEEFPKETPITNAMLDLYHIAANTDKEVQTEKINGVDVDNELITEMYLNSKPKEKFRQETNNVTNPDGTKYTIERVIETIDKPQVEYTITKDIRTEYAIDNSSTQTITYVVVEVSKLVEVINYESMTRKLSENDWDDFFRKMIYSNVASLMERR